MISLSEFKIVKEDIGDNTSKFTISPLPKGFGHTLGNNLRRILMSSIPGAAITSVKIDGIQHEYSTLSGVSDDILTILLSLKNVIFLSKTEEPVMLELEVAGKKGAVTEVKASDIKKNSDIEVINPDYVITKLTDNKTKLKFQLKVQRGVGYSLPNEDVRQELGTLPLDAYFSPVKLVNINVGHTRVGQQTDLDELILEVQTDGSVTPSDALNIASEIMSEMAQNFVVETKDMISGRALKSIPTEESIVTDEAVVETDENQIAVNDLNLTTRLTNALLRSGFDDLRKLEGFTVEEAANIRGMGEKSLKELLEILEKHGIKLI